MSRFTSVNRLEGTGISRSSGTVCLVTLEVWHGMHSLHQLEMSDCIPFQTHRLVMSLLVALVPAWEVVYRIEYTPSELLRYDGAWNTCRNIT